MGKAKDVLNLYEVEEKDFAKKQLAKGKKYQIVLPKGKGKPLYTADFNAAKEMAKEYGEDTQVIDLSKEL